jgi:hypothetical protein
LVPLHTRPELCLELIQNGELQSEPIPQSAVRSKTDLGRTQAVMAQVYFST